MMSKRAFLSLLIMALMIVPVGTLSWWSTSVREGHQQGGGTGTGVRGWVGNNHTGSDPTEHKVVSTGLYTGEVMHRFWVDDSTTHPGTKEIYHSVSTDTGITWSAPTNLTPDDGFDSRYFDVYAVNEDIGVAWVEVGDGIGGTGDDRVYFMHSSDGGQTWGAPIVAVTPTDGRAISKVSLAFNEDGDLAIGFINYTGINLRTGWGWGLHWVSEYVYVNMGFDVDLYVGDFWHTTIFNGWFVVHVAFSWMLPISPFPIYSTYVNYTYYWRALYPPGFRRSTDGGSGEMKPVGPGEATDARISGANNSLVISYTDLSGTPDVYFISSSNTGTTWGSPAAVSDTADGVADHPAVGDGVEAAAATVFIDVAADVDIVPQFHVGADDIITLLL